MFGTGVQTMFHGTSPESAQNIKAKGFQPSAPKGGFKTTWADPFQKGAKTFVSNPNVASTYGSTKIPIATSAGNLTSPIGGGITKTSVALGPERVLTPGQATKGMNLIEKAKQYANSPTAKKLLAGKTLGNVAKTTLGRANLPLTVGTTAFDIAMQFPTVQKYGTKLGEGLYDLLNPEAATPTPDAGTNLLPGFSRFMANDALQPPGSYNYMDNRSNIYTEKEYADLKNQRPTMADVAGPSTMLSATGSPDSEFEDVMRKITGDSEGYAAYAGIIPGFKARKRSDGRFEYKALDGQIYGPDTYEDIAAGKYPNIYDPRANVAGGGMPTGIMRSNQAGVMERDYRDEGGFVPVGIKEKADDVPAMLSKNEFVMTANAVRGAGNGSIEKGAQRMYDTMKRLEKRVR